ncbi:phosphotransferase [Streptomyces sp. AC627_RSS907]|uniref:phosphotransferase n=1 Tax=Streptomyces sp. AC627_RSS907 TaxID=2823684 RepID=UPI001C2479E0|nr:phosphotransferase [Streptomyces sp. AC627_RSS907]
MIRNDDLGPLLRTAPWMPEEDRRAARFECVDHAELGAAARLLVVAAVGGPSPGRRYFVPVRPDPTGAGVEEAHGSAEYDAAALDAVCADRRLPTARGGWVRFRGAGLTARSVRRLPFERGWSSNVLSLVENDGAAYVHKTYRRLDGTVREPELLRLMNRTGRTPGWAGDYTYVDPADGTHHPLGVFYGYAPGDGIDLPLRRSMRSLWPKVTGGHAPGDLDAVVREHLSPLAGNLRDAGRFLTGFHRDLAGRLGGGPVAPYPVREVLARATARVAALAPADIALPAAPRAAAFAALRQETAALHGAFDAAPAGFPSGPCHGDLHLSHLLCRVREEGGWSMNVIDMSTPALGPDQAGWAAQSPVQDFVAVQRALEYFTADEAAFESARRLGLDSSETMRGALDGADDWPPGPRAALRLVFHAADVWRARVLRLFLGRTADDPLRRLLYLGRLLHELAYNVEHARPYHAAIDLRHALALGARTPAPTIPART